MLCVFFMCFFMSLGKKRRVLPVRGRVTLKPIAHFLWRESSWRLLRFILFALQTKLILQERKHRDVERPTHTIWGDVVTADQKKTGELFFPSDAKSLYSHTWLFPSPLYFFLQTQIQRQRSNVRWHPAKTKQRENLKAESCRDCCFYRETRYSPLSAPRVVVDRKTRFKQCFA